MKKKRKNINNRNIIILIVVLLIIIFILSFVNVSKNKLTYDERYFKREYEKLNGKKNSAGKKYYSLNIDDDNGIEYLTKKEVTKFIKEETGILYFGFAQCLYCRSAVEVLLDAKDFMDIDKIYYYNAYGDRDEKYLDSSGEIYTLHQGSDTYYEILKLLGNKAEVYDGLNDNTIKRLYFPTVLFIKDGSIKKMHVSTVESNKDNKKLTKKEYNELKKIYIDGIKKIK